MEPNLITHPKLLNVLNELRAREPIFHHPEFGTSRSDFENMMEPSFWEPMGSPRFSLPRNCRKQLSSYLHIS